MTASRTDLANARAQAHEWPLWEVFVRPKAGLDHKHCGSLHAADSKMALQLAREAVSRALDLPIHEGLKIEADLSTLAYRTLDAEEGMAAFIEKRKPEWKDG